MLTPEQRLFCSSQRQPRHSSDIRVNLSLVALLITLGVVGAIIFSIKF